MVEILCLIFYKILYMSIVGTIVGTVILGIIKIFDAKLSAKWKSIMLLVPLLLFAIPINRIQINTDTEFSVSTAIEKVETTLTDVPTRNKENISYNEHLKDTLLNTDTKEISNNSQYEGRNIKYVIYEIVPIVWIVGCVLGLGILAIGNIALIFKINKLKTSSDERLTNILEGCKDKLKLKRKISIKLRDSLQSPCIYGLIHPKILIPKQFLNEKDEVISNVFMHELSHYKRKDIITNFILLIISIIHWFNPFIYIFFKKTRQNIEIATDEMATNKMNKEERKQYGFTLINLLGIYQNQTSAGKMLCMADDEKNMEKRIKTLKISDKLKKNKISILIIALILIICILIPFLVKTNIVISEEDNNLYKKVEEYLISKEEPQNMSESEEDFKYSDFHVFTDIAKLGISKNEEETYIYVWALVESYYVQDGKLISNGGYSIPHKFTIRDNEVVNCEIPKDGSEYEASIKELFPSDIQAKLSIDLVDVDKVERQVQEHYAYLESDATGNNNITEEDLNIGKKLYTIIENDVWSGNWTKNNAETKNGYLTINCENLDKYKQYMTEDLFNKYLEYFKITKNGNKYIYQAGYGANPRFISDEIAIKSKSDNTITFNVNAKYEGDNEEIITRTFLFEIVNKNNTWIVSKYSCPFTEDTTSVNKELEEAVKKADNEIKEAFNSSYYVGSWTDEDKLNDIVIKKVNKNKITFDLGIHRVTTFENLTATIDDNNIATFNTNDTKQGNAWKGVYGSLKFVNDNVILEITKSESEYIQTGLKFTCKKIDN